MVVRKKDRELFIKTVVAFIEKHGRQNRINGGHTLDTIHGDLVVHQVESWNEPGSECLSVMARFVTVSKDIPPEANQYSGKWNVHLSCPVGEGKAVAAYVVKRFEEVLK